MGQGRKEERACWERSSQLPHVDGHVWAPGLPPADTFSSPMDVPKDVHVPGLHL